jgi:sialic acid synthase
MLCGLRTHEQAGAAGSRIGRGNRWACAQGCGVRKQIRNLGKTVMTGSRPSTSNERSLRIAGRTIDDRSSCYTIAEIGHNHQGSVATCRRMFASAKDAGADAVKLQKRHNRSLFTSAFYNKPYGGDQSYGATYGEHREALEFDAAQYAELFTYADEIGITLFATAFDEPSVEFLEQFDPPAYKVASGDVCNLALLREIARTGKPVIFSTGGAEIDQVRRAHDTLGSETDQLCVLQCTAGYPAAWDEMDLRVIDTYRRMFPTTVVGLSSHDNGIAMAVAAYVLGARIVEKHFTLDRTMRGSDHAFSLEPQGMGKMCRDLERLHVAMGDGAKRVHPSERAPIEKMAKKLVAARDLEAGEILCSDDIAAKSPRDGLCASKRDLLLGKRLTTALAKDADFTLDIVGEPADSRVSLRERQPAAN